MLVGPRSRIDGAEPGRPLPDTTCAPAILPWIAETGFSCGTGPRSSSASCATSNGTFARCVAPATPVTTISWSAIASDSSEIVIVSVSPSVTFT